MNQIKKYYIKRKLEKKSWTMWRYIREARPSKKEDETIL